MPDQWFFDREGFESMVCSLEKDILPYFEVNRLAIENCSTDSPEHIAFSLREANQRMYALGYEDTGLLWAKQEGTTSYERFLEENNLPF